MLASVESFMSSMPDGELNLFTFENVALTKSTFKGQYLGPDFPLRLKCFGRTVRWAAGFAPKALPLYDHQITY